MADQFCRTCRRMLSPAEFYTGNRSTCRSCKGERARAARRADPAAAARYQRTVRARQKLRAEFAVFVLQRLLPGADEVWRQLDDDLADQLDRDSYLAAVPAVDEARRRWSQLFTAAVHLAEDQLQLDPGTGLDTLARILRKQRNSC